MEIYRAEFSCYTNCPLRVCLGQEKVWRNGGGECKDKGQLDLYLYRENFLLYWGHFSPLVFSTPVHQNNPLRTEFVKTQTWISQSIQGLASPFLWNSTEPTSINHLCFTYNLHSIPSYGQIIHFPRCASNLHWSSPFHMFWNKWMWQLMCKLFWFTCGSSHPT